MHSESFRAWLWIPVFFAINLIWRLPGNPNPGSRIATLAALSEYHTFRIDPYVRGPAAWTNDWAQTPDGHFYSNKAPGPMLLGWPVFKLLDLWITRGIDDPSARDLRRRASLARYNIALCLVLQLLPMALMTIGILRWLQRRNVSASALHFTTLALLFGQTAALLMNTFFGHAVAAIAWLAFAWALAEKRGTLAGLSLGLAVLSDYGGLAVLPAAMILWGIRIGRDRQSWRNFALGAIGPIAAWGLYHGACFGSPFILPQRYQNPEFVDLGSIAGVWWGMFRFHPTFDALYGLLLGPERSLLVTAPWILVSMAGLWKTHSRWNRDDKERFVVWFGCAGLLSLLMLNASFGAWHGGRTMGPRYLSILLPVWGILAAFTFSWTSRVYRICLWTGLGLSLTLAFLVFQTTLYIPPGLPLWKTLSHQFWERHRQ